MENLSVKDKKSELIILLDEMIKNIEELPSFAMTTSITQYDFCSLLMLLSSLFKCDLKSEDNHGTS